VASVAVSSLNDVLFDLLEVSVVDIPLETRILQLDEMLEC
jgi:hypothetical protein